MTKIKSAITAALLLSAVYLISHANPAPAASGVLTDPRDGQKYRTVEIGGLTWMAQNLNFAADSSWCYGNDEGNCQKYGRLYHWNAAIAACPADWRLPGDAEWESLIQAAGGKAAGSKLKSKKALWNGADNYGWSATPGGGRDLGAIAEYYSVGTHGYWWAAVEGTYGHNGREWKRETISIVSDGRAYGRYMNTANARVGEIEDSKKRGLSVRCVQGSVSPAAPAPTPAVAVDAGVLTDPRDGKKYRTVTIGAQTWMAENLNFTIAGSQCNSNNNAHCQKYGRLYNWNAATTACPAGWRLPRNADWKALIDFAGGNPGTKLKAQTGWGFGGPGVLIPGTDDIGFSALPGGCFSAVMAGGFNGPGGIAYWWSATETASRYPYAVYWSLDADNGVAHSDAHKTNDRFSVRCIRE